MTYSRLRPLYLLAVLAGSLLAGSFLPRPLLAGDTTGGDIAAELWDAPPFTADPPALLEAAAALPVEDGDDVQILLRERTHRFEVDGRGLLRHRVIYRILTPVGLEGWSSLSVAWRPWHQERPRLRVRVLTPAGGEHWLDPATVSESPVGDDSPNVLSDRLQLQAPLPAVTIGAMVEELVEIRDTSPLFAGGTVHRFNFGRGIPVHRTRLTLDAAESLPLRWVTRLLDDARPRRSTGDGRLRLVFEAADLAAVESIETLAPGDVPLWPVVRYSTGESWAEVARRYSEIVDHQIGEPDLGKVVKKALRGAAGREEKAARLLAWLQSEIRYTGLEFGEAAIVPRSPEETLRRRYGDCKDKATLLVALLRAAGIPAHLALLDNGPGMDVEPELPGVGDFDHAIVYVPGDRDLWIDPTDEFAAVGELPASDQGRLALVARPGATALVTTPAAEPADNRSVETREIYLAADLGGARIVETSRSWGSIGRGYRRSYGRLDTVDLEESFADYVRTAYVSEDLLGWELSDAEDLTGPFEIRLETAGARMAFTDMTEAVVAIHPRGLFDRLPEEALEDPDEDSDGEPEDAAARRSDLVLPEPYIAEWRYRIVPPAGYRPTELPEPEVRPLGPASLAREVTVDDDGVVHFTWRFDTVKRRFTPAELDALGAGVRELLAEEATLLHFEQVGELHLANGEIREALAELDRLAALAPARALPRVRRSRALLAAGLGEAARREGRAAVELDPELDLAHQNLAWLLQHDLIGRLRRKGFDRDGAIAAYRKAAELDPSNVVTRFNLAILLEHDREGMRYSPRADVERAIEEYRSVFEESDDTGLEDNLLVALTRAGRFEEILERVRELGSSASRDTLELVALAASRDPVAAVREARKISQPEQQQAALASGAQTLMQLRLYPQAAELFTAAARGADKATEVLALAETLRKTRRYEELDPAADDPRSLVRRLMSALLLGGEEEIEPLFSERISEDFRSAEVAGSRQLLVPLREQLRQSSVAVEMVLDLLLSGLQLSLDGDDELGYRLRARWRFGDVSNEMLVFAIREDGGYRFLGSADHYAPLGAEALRRLQAGEPQAARQWLDWARHLTPAPPADDPFAGEPFFHFWTLGSDPPDQEAIRVAAASLMAGGDAEAAIPILLQLSPPASQGALQGREQAVSEDRRRAFDIALARAYARLERHAEVLPLARRWLAERPDSVAALAYLQQALAGLERWDEIERAAGERLALLPDDPFALHVLAGVEQARGDIEGQDRIGRRLVDLGEATATDYNNLAWNSVLRGDVDDEALASAQQAVAMDGGGSVASLNTLASVYAELERPAEARQVLLQQMRVGGYDEPRSYDWYVLGRIAESYGVTDAAIEAYRRVEAPETEAELAVSVYRVARRHLERLTERDAS